MSNDAPVWDTNPPPAPAVQLRWTNSSNVTGYEVYRNGTKIYPASGTYSGTTFYNNAGLTSGQTYSYYILAKNSAGSRQSNTINVGPMPSAPAPVPGSFTLSNDAPVWDTNPPPAPAVQLRWTNSSNATSYEVYRNGTKIYPASGTFTGTTFYNNAGLTSGQTYGYYILAKNSAGSRQSNTINVGPMPGAPALTAQTITFAAQTSPRTFVSGSTFAISPLATASSGLVVTYSSTTSGVCTVSGTTVTMVAAGTCSIAANQAGNSGYSAAPQVTQNVVLTLLATPTLSFTATPASIAPRQSSTLSWSSTNATSCTASGAWTGAKSIGGSLAVSPSATATYTLTCSGTGGSVAKSVTVTVTSAAPTLSFTATPASIARGQSSTLSWSSTNATSCSASGAWTGAKNVGGSQAVSPSATATYTLTCSGMSGSVAKSVAITVTSTAPTLGFTATPASIVSGQSSTLSWSSTNATSCAASGGWAGTKRVSGSQAVSPSATTIYTLSCSGTGGAVMSSVTVTVQPIAAQKGQITSPLPGSILPGSSVIFNWTTGTGVSQYWLDIGTSQGGNQLYSQSQGTNLAVTVSGLPTNGSTIYVRLWSLISGSWQFNDYTYLAASNATRFLSFPLLCWDPGCSSGGYTDGAYTQASPGGTPGIINSVLDHSMLSPYDFDGLVLAFTGESRKGDKEKGGCYPDKGAAPISVRDLYRGTQGKCSFRDGLNYEGHPGYDFHAQFGMPVFPAAAGHVVNYQGQRCVPKGISERCDTWGYVGVDHGNGYVTQYGHLTGIDPGRIRVGARVEVDQPIGLSGATAPRSKPVGPHLHFEVLKTGPCPFGYCVVDPYGWEGTGADPLEQATGIPNVRLWK